MRLEAPVHVDGALTEAAWRTPGQEGLIQNEPVNGAPPRQPTRWWIAYDDEALYAAFRMEDAAPESVDTSVSRRDDYVPTDAILLELDTYNDDRNGYLFLVGAGGLTYDSLVFNDGAEDPSWDGVWTAAARVDSEGWTCEMRIPFSQLRFPSTSDQVWGVNVSRRCKRTQERDDLFNRPRNESGHVSRFPDLVGIHDLPRSQDREALLYGTARGEYLRHEEGDPFNDGSRYAYDLGGDLKWGLTSNFILNATLNPDFGQVEVDPAVVNLSDSETYFEEKRPFFVEGSSLFRFGRNGTNGNWNFNWTDPILFYSRRVGRNPQLEVQGDPDFSRAPNGTTILGAAKATGKLGGYQVGALSALTGRERYRLWENGRERDQLAEPLTGYTALRVNRDAENGRRALGGMFTAVNRDLSTGLAREALPGQAYSGGVDGWIRLDEDETWALRGYLAGSLIEGSREAILDQQTSSRRYYQRPDAGYLGVDSTRTSLAGWTSRIMLNKESGDLTLNTAVGAVSPGFEINDMGYETRADLVNWHLAAGRQWTEPNRWVRNRSLSLTTYWTWDFGGTRTGGGYGLFWWTQFANYWEWDGHVFYNPPALNNRVTRGGPLLRTPANRELQLNVATDSRKPYVIGLDGFLSSSSAQDRYAYGGLDLTLKPTPGLRVSAGPGVTWQKDDAQYVTTVDAPAATATCGKRYVFADLAYRELAMSFRTDWAFTPRLTLQSYVQPLIAVGRYSALKEFTAPSGYDFRVYGRDGASGISYDPGAGEYAVDPGDGGSPFTVDDPDFNYKSLRVNLVLRWEYRPGSTLFLVWTRNGVDQRNPGELDFARDVDALFSARTDNVFALKVTRWLDF